MKRLEGKVAFVTGGGSGIGAHVAVSLAEEGARVAVTGRTQAPLNETVAQIKAKGSEGLALSADVGNYESVEAAIKTVIDRWGQIDLLVLNAGTNIQKRSLKELSVEDWQMVVNTNLNGVYYCVHAALPPMRAKKTGTIIIISSRAARQPTGKAGVAYSASKAGLTHLTQVINKEEQPFNIRASVIYPGEVNTPILDRRPQPPSAEHRAAVLQPEDISACVLLIATLPPRANIAELLIQPTMGETGYGI